MGPQKLDAALQAAFGQLLRKNAGRSKLFPSMNAYIIYPMIALALVIIVLVGCTEILARATRRIIRIRSIVEASRRYAPINSACVAIDYTVSLQRQEQDLKT